MDMYANLLMVLSIDDPIRIRDVPLVNQTQVDRAIAQGRGKQIEFAWPTELYTRFDEIRIAYASEVAIRDNATALTYSELTSQINGIAKLLLENGSSSSRRVAVLCQPSSDAIACMLAGPRRWLRLRGAGCALTTKPISMIDNSTTVLLLFRYDTRDAALDL